MTREATFQRPPAGIRANVKPFALLVLVNAFVGAMVGIERSTLPLLAESAFGIASAVAAFSFIVTFGLSKALVNLFAGALADRFGRRRVLLAGWLLAIPVPIILLVAPNWSWVVAANALLGASQGLAWSMSVNMKLDLATPRERGLAVGWNEAAGYLGVAVAAFFASELAATYGPRTAPYVLGLVIALGGLALSALVRETMRERVARSRLWPALVDGSGRNPQLTAASFAGLATNLKDGVLWGALPLALAREGHGLRAIGIIVAAYPLAWGVSQLATGALSDRWGRRALVVPGLALQAVSVVVFAFAPSANVAILAAVAAGVGTALAYPALLAFVGDRARSVGRATALGVYRAWRDAGYAAGALLAGFLADSVGLNAVFFAAAVVLVGATVLFLAATKKAPGRERGTSSGTLVARSADEPKERAQENDGR